MPFGGEIRLSGEADTVSKSAGLRLPDGPGCEESEEAQGGHCS